MMCVQLKKLVERIKKSFSVVAGQGDFPDRTVIRRQGSCDPLHASFGVNDSRNSNAHNYFSEMVLPIGGKRVKIQSVSEKSWDHLQSVVFDLCFRLVSSTNTPFGKHNSTLHFRIM